jgi:hypothetical protein
VRGARKEGFNADYYEDDAYGVNLVGLNALVALLDSSSLTELNVSKNSVPKGVKTQLKKGCELMHIKLKCKGEAAVNEEYPIQVDRMKEHFARCRPHLI